MSVDIGSAHGSIEIKTDGVLTGARSAAAALREFDASTKNVGSNLKAIGNDGAAAGQQVAQATKQATAGVKDLSAATKDISGQFGKIGTAATVAGAALAAGLGASVKEAASLQQAVARVSTIAPEIDTSKVENALSGMSTRVAQSSTQLAESLNNIFSSIETNQEGALKLTEEFGRSAVAASTDAETFGSAALGVMNAYGLGVESASHISDVFFNTINKGVISGDQLARGLGQVTQAAKLAGVDFDTLGALIAGVTREGGDAAVNMTNLQNALTKIATPQAQAALAELGIATKDASGNIRSIIDVLTDLDRALKTLAPSARTEVLRGIFPDQQAVAGISTLLNQLPTINETLKLNTSAAGSASAAYEKMGATAANQAKLLRNTFMATLNEIGTEALPGAVAIATQLRNVLVSFNQLSDGTQSAIVGIAAVGAGALLAVGALVKLTQAAIATAEAFAAIRAASVAMGGLSTAAAVGGPALIAVGLAAAGTALKMDELRRSTSETAKVISGDLGNAIAKINFSNGEAFLAFLTGEAVGADKAAEATKRWAAGMEGTAPTLTQLHTQLEITAAAYSKLVAEGGVNTPQAAALRAITGELFNQIAAWEKLNQEQAVRDRFLTSEAETEQVATAAAREHAAAIANLKTQLSEMNGEQARQKFTGGGALAQGALGVGGASQELTRSMAQLNQLGTDATAIDAAQVAAKLALVNSFNAQQAAIQNTASAIAPLNTAMAQLAQKQAEGLPLTAQEVSLWNTLPGIVGAAASATESLNISAAQTAVNMIAAAGGVGTFGGAAGSSTSQIDALRGAIITLNEAFGALGTQDSQLTAFAAKFQARIDVLEASKKAGTITPAETGELEHLLDLQSKIGDQLAINAAKEREIAENILAATQAKKEQEIVQQNARDRAAADTGNEIAVDPASLAAVKAIVNQPVPVNLEPAVDDASLAAVRATLAQPVKVPLTVEPSLVKTGLDSATAEAMGIIGGGGGTGATSTVTITANDQATSVINNVKQLLTEYAQLQPNTVITANGTQASGTAQSVTSDVNAIPTEHNTIITATNNASNVIQEVINSLSSLPTSFTVTANVDTSGALAAIADLRANMPSSPAEKGPFSTLPDWSSVYQSLEPAGDEAVRQVEKTVQQMGEGITAGISKIDTESAKNAADFASSIASAVTATVGATEALARLRTPNEGKITQLRDSIQAIMTAFAGVAGEPSTEDAKKAAQEWNDNASSILSLVSAGVDSLSKLGTFERPTDQAVRSFRDVAQFVVNLMTQVAADTSISAVVAAGVWADGAGKIFESVSKGIDSLAKLDDFTRPTDQAVLSFRDVAQFVVNVFAQVAADSELGPVADAGTWADSAIKVLALVGTGVDALTKLEDFTRPTDQAIRSFRDVAQFFVNVIAQVAADSDQKAVEAAGKYAENASKIVGLIGAGVSAFKELSSAEFIPPSTDSLRSLADATRRAVIAIEEASADLDTKGVAAAGVYADSAVKVVSLIGAGIEGFSKLATLVPPSAEQIHNFKSVVSRTVIEIAQAAKELDADAVKAAGEYADGAGKAVGLLGMAIGAFGSLDDEWVAPSKEAIQAVVNVTAYAVQQLAGIAGSFDKGLLTKLSEFGEAASSGFGAIRGALDAGKALEEDHVKPADAIGVVLSEFQAGLGPLGQLALVSQQYRTQGLEIGANIAQAYASIGASIPGFTPQSQQVTATVTGANTQMIVHHFEGGINISFLGENGTWVVRSLQADETSRRSVSDMIAGDIAGIFTKAGSAPVGV